MIPLALRRELLLSLVALFLCSCGPSRGPSTPIEISSAPRDKEAVVHVLDDFHDAAARADEARYFAHFAEAGVFLGTDANERWDVPAFRAYAHPHFAKGKAWRFRTVRRDIAFAPGGKVAWFDEDLATEKLGPARGSGVLLSTPSGWKIVQYNLSVTIPNERFSEVRAVLERPAPSAP